MSNYILENSEESERLEKQSQNEQFNLEKEISHFDLSSFKSVLDAGCGSGLLGRYLQKKYPDMSYSGCDQSQERIKYAKVHGPKHFNFFTADIYDDNFTSDKYDLIISRYVLHHLENPTLAITNLKKKLMPGGKIIIVDVDGLMLNIGTENIFILDCLDKIKNGFTGSLNAGRRWPGILNQLNFKNIKYRIDVMDFQNNDRQMEVEQFNLRLEFAKPMLSKIIGSEFEFMKFKQQYLLEIGKEHVSFFYNRFIIEADV
jgi:SAM-dependent methyltransferase